MKLLSKISASSVLLSLLIAQLSKKGSAAGLSKVNDADDDEGKVRFEKFAFAEDKKKKSITFPINDSDADYLRVNSGSISVIRPSEGCTGISFTDLKKSLTLTNTTLYPPSHPENEEFWGELKEVAVAVTELKKYEKSRVGMGNTYSLPDPLPDVMERITHLWNGKLDIIEVAKAVQDEFPGVYHGELIADWLEKGTLKRKPYLFPTKNNKDFLRFPVMLSDLVGHAIRMVGPCDFSLKWDVGRARPEEVAWKIKDEGLTVPSFDAGHKAFGLEQLIDELDFDSATEFTAYEEGSPNHPSYPAMHSAASAASFWLDVTMELTDEQLCEARMLDYSIAYARTVAGVHYPSDNMAGLMVGQEILAQKLPRYLHDEYGADFTLVKEAVEAARFDWTMFSTTDCWNNSKQYFTVSKGEQVETCKGEEVETCNGKHVKSSKGEQVKSSKGERVKSSKGERVKSSKGEQVKSSKGEQVKSSKGEQVKTYTATS